MEPILFSLPDAETHAARLADSLDIDVGEVSVRRFPDGESWLRVAGDCGEREAIVVADLTRPDARVCQLIFLAQTLRDVGAGRVGLVAPYLPYMRQDERFEPGEAVTSRYFADLLSTYFDWLVTLDPHLHRHDSLSQVYRIPTFEARAAPAVADWVDQRCANPVLIGPDAESEQWVEQVASLVECPRVIFEKTRHGDRQVELDDVDLSPHRARQPVVVDDIISTGTTMAKTIERIGQAGLEAPHCVGIHGVFTDGAAARLEEAGARSVVTCNTILHPTNAIDALPALAEQVAVALRHTSADAAE